jgi:outer membrane protein assembly factor BamB
LEPLGAGDPGAVGEYRLHARLGAGGMGRVFLGYSLAGRAVAVKVVHPDLARDQAFVRRFRHEVAAAQAVSGAYTAPVVAAGLDDDPPWLATVFVPGPSLDAAVAVVGPLPEPAVWKLAAGLVEALRAIHAANLVHRDLKPQNVLLAADGPRVIDFGIARALDGTMVTATGTVVGTPSFMSPEQAQGAPTGPESDVFSLGCLLAFAATGGGPFGEGSPATLLYRIVHAEPAVDRVPDGLRELVTACLAKLPASRPLLSQLAYDITARATPGNPAPASFWPGAVAEFISAYQFGPGGGVMTADARGSAGGQPTVLPADSQAAPGHHARHAVVARAASPRWRGTAGAGRHAATAVRTQPVRDGGLSAIERTQWPGSMPAEPARQPPTVEVPDLQRRPSLPGHPGPTITRRGVLGLSVAAAAGLAVAGWELSRGRPPSRPAGATGSLGVPPGTRLWSFRTGGQVVADLATVSGVIFAGSTDDSVYALSASGRKIWSVPTGGAVRSGPAVARGVVYVGSDDQNVYALRASNGAELWNFPTGGAVTADPAVASGVVYVGSDDHKLYALATTNGQGLWAFRTNGAVTGQAVVTAGLVLVVSNDDNLYALHRSSGDEFWGGSTGGPITRGPAVLGGVAYLGSTDQHVYAINASSGHEIWSHLTGGPVNCTPAVADGVVYVGSDDHNVYALQASNGARLWARPTGSVVRSMPAVANGVVYVGSDDHTFYALRASNGGLLWQFRTGGPITSAPVAADGVVYVGSGDGSVYALRA